MTNHESLELELFLQQVNNGIQQNPVLLKKQHAKVGSTHHLRLSTITCLCCDRDGDDRHHQLPHKAEMWPAMFFTDLHGKEIWLIFTHSLQTK